MASDDKTRNLGMASMQQEAEEKQEASKKVQDQMQDLTAAKDRAQLSQASAMSILDVKILADLVRDGPGHSMYIPLLVLVTLALFLQVVVGFISLMISNIKNRYNKVGSGSSLSCVNCFSRETGADHNDRQDAIADAQAIYDLRPVSLERAEAFGEPSRELQAPSSRELLINSSERQPLREVSSHDHSNSMLFHGEQIELPEIRIAPVVPESVKPSLAEIYGTAPPAEEIGHLPPPYEKSDWKANEPKNMKAKTVTRLRALVDQMMESKEGEIETKINTEFLQEKLARDEEKLKLLQQSLDESQEQEAGLSTDWESAKGHWEKVIEEMSLLKAPYVREARRLQLRKRLDQLRERQQQIEIQESSARTNLMSIKERNDKIFEEAIHIVQKNVRERQRLRDLPMGDKENSSGVKPLLDDLEKTCVGLANDLNVLASHIEDKTTEFEDRCSSILREIKLILDCERQNLAETGDLQEKGETTEKKNAVEELIAKLQALFDSLEEKKDKLSRIITAENHPARTYLDNVVETKRELEAELQNAEDELHSVPDVQPSDDQFQKMQRPELLKQKFHLLEIEEKHAYEKLCHIEKRRMKAKEVKEDAERVESEIRAIKQEKERQETRLREFKMNEGRFKFYQKMADDIEKRKTLEVVMYWQNVINCLLYTVFVLNAFIATLSLV